MLGGVRGVLRRVGVPRCVVGNAATAALRFAEIYSHFWGPSRSPPVCAGLGSCTLLAIRLSSCGLRYWGGKDLGVLPAPLGFSRCRQQYMFLSPPGSSVCGLLGRSLPGDFPFPLLLTKGTLARGRTEESCREKQPVSKEMLLCFWKGWKTGFHHL